MTTIIFNEQSAVSALKERLNADMLAAAEPLIQAALKDIEAAIRREAAACLVGLVEQSVSFDRRGDDLRITLLQAFPAPNPQPTGSA